MITRLKKDVRGQLPALGLVAVVGAIVAVRGPLAALRPDSLMPTLALEVGPLLLIAVICMAASSLYTSEYHWRTLQLLLAQPVSRARIWIEKFAIIAAGLILFGILFALLNRLSDAVAHPSVEIDSVRYSLGNMLSGSFTLWWLAILVTVCSAPFWSLLTRTLIGAVALNIASQAFVVLLVNAGFHFVQRGTSLFAPDKHPERMVEVFLVVGLAYAAAFAWLGWRKFKSLEIADGSGDVLAGGRVEAAAGLCGTLWKASLPDRMGTLWNGLLPEASLPRSFLAKELRLQKPTLLLGGLLTVLWLAAVAVRLIFPGAKEDIETFLGIAVAMYVPLVVLLASGVSIAEESRIGIYEWHLTFPVSRWRIWAWKLGVGIASALLLGACLPLLLGVATLSEIREVTAKEPGSVIAVFLVLSAVFIVGFWAATYLRDVVRCTLAAGVTMVAGWVLAALAVWAAEDIYLQMPLVSWYIAWMQLDTVAAMNHFGRFASVVCYLSLPLLFVWLSLRAVRRNIQGVPAFVRAAGLVLVAVMVLAFWAVDLMRSAMAANAQILNDLNTAVQRLPEGPRDKEGFRKIPLEELERTGVLSSSTRYWLRGRALTLNPNGGWGLSEAR